VITRPVARCDRADHPTTDGTTRRHALAGIAAVDALLEILEQCHLDGQEMRGGMPPAWRRDLEALGLAVPLAVSAAATTCMLHEQLVDWQEELLDTAYPRRAIKARSERGSNEEAGTPVVRRHQTHRRYPASRQSALRLRRLTPRHRTVDPAVGAPPPPSADSRVRVNQDGLTDREIIILGVVAEGLTNAQAARRLHLSEHTVAAHLRSIFRKAGVASRTAATRYALERGLT
jgi:DNA-binding CsgD family transcriptional regulator